MTLQKSCLLPELSLHIKAWWGKPQECLEPLSGGSRRGGNSRSSALLPHECPSASLPGLSRAHLVGAKWVPGHNCTVLLRALLMGTVLGAGFSSLHPSHQVTAPLVPSNGNTAHGLNKAMGQFHQTMAGFLRYLLQPLLNQNIMQLSKTKTRSLLSKYSTETAQNILC